MATTDPKIALFLDAGYLDKLCQDTYADRSGGRKVPLPLDFKLLPSKLVGDKVWRTFYYFCPPYQSDPPLPAEHAAAESKRRFTDFLGRQHRWVMREGVLERRGSAMGQEDVLVQKRVDVMLAVDMARLAWRGEIVEAVLLAGDSDFVPLVADVRRAGVRVRLLHGPGTAHPDLVTACDEARMITREQLESVRLR